MSLSERLNRMEQEIRDLKAWKADIEAAFAAAAEEDEQGEEKPVRTLDGEEAGLGRDQTQSLG